MGNGSSNYDKQSKAGLGILLISKSCGLIGKNLFQDYEVSPIMVFSTCHPLLRDNSFAISESMTRSRKALKSKCLSNSKQNSSKRMNIFTLSTVKLPKANCKMTYLRKTSL